MNNWKIIIIAGAGIFAALVLLRKPASNSTGPQNIGTNAGVGMSYLDGSGMQHFIATDPYGYMSSYTTTPEDASANQTNQLASYIGSMGYGSSIPYTYGSSTPYYAAPSSANTLIYGQPLR